MVGSTAIIKYCNRNIFVVGLRKYKFAAFLSNFTCFYVSTTIFVCPSLDVGAWFINRIHVTKKQVGYMGQSIQEWKIEICGRQPLKNMNCLNRPYHFKCFKGCLPQISLGPFLNTFSHM